MRLTKAGFFYITNFGLSQEQINQRFAIGKEFFALPEKTRMQYCGPLDEGNYNGYRPHGRLKSYMACMTTWNSTTCSRSFPKPSARNQRLSSSTGPRQKNSIVTCMRTLHTNSCACSLSSWSCHGFLTYVSQQPVSALQVRRTEESDWEHIHMPEGLVVVNIADNSSILGERVSQERYPPRNCAAG